MANSGPRPSTFVRAEGPTRLAWNPRTVAASTGSRPMQTLWGRIEAWLDAHVPGGANILAPGATTAESTYAERSLGVSFPEDVRDSFRLHDGQSDGPWLMWGDDLMSLSRIRDEWGSWKGLLDA